MRKYSIQLLLLVLALLVFPAVADAQCAMCNATASTANDGNNEGALALNSGILFLMAIPYLLLTGIVVIMYIFRRQKRAEQKALNG